MGSEVAFEMKPEIRDTGGRKGRKEGETSQREKKERKKRMKWNGKMNVRLKGRIFGESLKCYLQLPCVASNGVME